MSIDVHGQDRLAMSQRERDLPKVMGPVLQGQRTHCETGRLAGRSLFSGRTYFTLQFISSYLPTFASQRGLATVRNELMEFPAIRRHKTTPYHALSPRLSGRQCRGGCPNRAIKLIGELLSRPSCPPHLACQQANLVARRESRSNGISDFAHAHWPAPRFMVHPKWESH